MLSCITAIDALPTSPRTRDQIARASMERDMLKAFAGFSTPDNDLLASFGARPIVTGNWGCGVFGGNRTLKSTLQWLAASAAGHDMTYVFAVFCRPLC